MMQKLQTVFLLPLVLLGLASAQIVLIVTPGPLVTEYGRMESIGCLATISDINSEAKVYWNSTAENADLSNTTEEVMRDNLEYVDFLILTISVDSDYCGLYTCTEVSLPNDVFFDSIYVDVAPAIFSHPENTSIGSSQLTTDTVSFICIVDGGRNKGVQIVWIGPNSTLITLSWQNIVEFGNGRVRSILTLSGITYDHVGDYWCIANYTDEDCRESSESTPGTLFIVEAPQILIEPDPPQQNVSAGSTLSYSCTFNASERASRLSFQLELSNFSVFWVGPSGVLQNSSVYEIIHSFDEEIANTTLILKNVSSADGGLYTCVAENIDGSDNGTVLLYVDPVIDPTNYTATVNDTLVIFCDVQDFPAPNFRWQKEINGTFFTLDPMLLTGGGDVIDTTKKNLTIVTVLFGFDGVYRCVSNTTEFGSLVSNGALITVSPESGVAVSPVDQIFGSDDNVTLTCTTQGGPNNQFNWTVLRNDETIQGPLTPTFDLFPVQGGLYTCEVGNTAGSGFAMTTVFVSLRFVVHPNDTLTRINMRAVLTCVAESFPDPTYEWFRLTGDFRSNVVGLNSSSLVINPVLFGDEGDYYCQATSRSNFTLNSTFATLTVSPQTSVIVQPDVQVASFLEEVTFNCSSQGGPNNAYQWYKDSQLLTGQTGQNITVNVSAADGGVYTCIVTNAAGNGSDSAVLYVRPYIVVFPVAEITTTNGSMVNFTCVAEGFPQPMITWLKVNASERILTGSGEVLDFRPVRFGDEGVYECVASSSVPDETNSTQATAVLTVSPEGSVGVTPLDRVYYYLDNVTFICSYLGGLNNVITWSKDGVELPGEVEKDLILPDISSDDGGLYTCTVSNSAGNESASTALYIAPYFVEYPIGVLADNGTNVNFSCLAEAFPSPTYVWMRAGEDIRAEAVGQNNSVLSYLPVLFGDEGLYFCEATILNVSIPSLLAVLTLAPGGVTITASPSDEIFLGGKVNFTCDHFGGPNNSYHWLKDGERLPNENTTSLVLTNVTAADGGIYTCVVTNPAGNASRHIPLYIQPYITVFPRALMTVENGSFANFTCEALGFPAPNITWIKYESYDNRSTFVAVSNGDVLAFEPILFGDEGYYACVASSQRFDGMQLVSASSEPSELAVSPAPSVTIADHNGTYFLGDNTTLTCSSLGGPNNTYSWQLNGDIIAQGPSLELTGISSTSGGEYTCIVANIAGTDTDSTFLYVHPYIVMAPELNIYTMDGDYVSIECIADGFPAPNVTWESLGLELGDLGTSNLGNGMSGSGMAGEGRVELPEFDNGPLEFSLVTFGDEGYYRCVVSAQTLEDNALETVTSQPTLVTVSPEGSVRITPEFQALERFGSITFTCSSLGGPNNTYQWQKDTSDLLNETSSLLTVSNVSATDGGTYSCLVSNAAGNETVNSTLYIEPYIIANPVSDILSSASGNVSFECEAESFPSPRYLWEKVTDNDTVVGESRVLSLNPVVFGDEGPYRCIAYITANGTNTTAVSDTGLLTISPERGVSSSPPTHNSTRNQTVQFLCLSLGGPGNAFYWTRLLDGSLLSMTSLLEVRVQGEYDGGDYRCDVANRAGNGSFQVTLNVAPMITEHPLNLNVTITNSFSLSCGANGYPIPSIVWLLNGSEVEIFNDTFSSGSGFSVRIEESYGLRSISSRLTVSMAMTNDSGNYTCRIISSIEEYQALITQPSLVLVQDVPDPPHSIVSQLVTNTSMILVWMEPHDNNAPIQGYEITYHDPLFLGGGEVTLNSTVVMRFISGLHPGVVYNFTVVATNEIGVSRPSDITGLPTLDEEPDSPPLNLTTTVVSSTSVFLSWVELPEIDRNGIITTYEVMYTPLVNCSSVEAGRRNGSGDSTQLMVDGLEENIPYNFSVRAYTSAGPGPFGEEVTNTTMEDAPSAPPNNVNVTAVSPTELLVEWDPISCQDQNGEVILYEVFYQTFDTFDEQLDVLNFTLNTSNRSAVLGDLEEYVEYEVVVRGYTSVGPGPYSTQISETTEQSKPTSSPMNVSVFTVSSTELEVTWTEVPAIHRNGIITRYEILYEPLNTFEGLIGFNNVTVLHPGLIDTLTGLEEDVEYNVSIRAYTVVGPGPYSGPVSNRTLQDVPGSPPSNITVTPASPSQLTVTWGQVPEIDQNGPIILYDVLYSPLDTFDGQLNTSYTVSTNLTSVVLEDLEEFLEYNVSVRAYTEVGPGNYSEPVSNITDPAAPNGTVQNVIVYSLSPTTLTVQWDEVEPINRNGIQSQYEIVFEPVTIFDNYIISNGSETTVTPGQYMLRNLEEYVLYNITVRSYTIIGPGPYSSVVMARTQEGTPSGPPRNVAVEVLSSTEVHVEWDDVVDFERNGVIIFYEVMLQPFTTFDNQIPISMAMNVSGEDLNVTVSGLEEFVEYNVTVGAGTVAGPGPFSQEINVTTQPGLPGSPVNVSVSNVSSTNLMVTWKPPDLINQNGIIEGYTIELNQSRFTEIPPVKNITVTAGANNLLVSDLEEDTEYLVRVLAVNSVGDGPYNDGVSGITNEDRPSAPPQNLAINAAGPNNLSVSWLHPPAIDTNGKLTLYNITYREVNSSVGSEMLLKVLGSSMSAELSGLENFTEYTVTVAAHTRVGEGPPAVMNGTTAENVPGEPPTVTMVTSKSFETIEIAWIPPREEFLYGILRGYTVRYLNNQSPGQGYVYIRGAIPASSTTYTISGLLQFTNYSVEIAAVTVGEGVFSDPMSAVTDEDAPDGFPDNIQVTPQSKTLLVTWEEVPRSLRNGLITLYEIRYIPLETYGGQIQSDTVTTDVRSLTVEGLEEDTPYNVSVRAYTKIGPGPYSDQTSVSTTEGVPSAPPSNVMVSNTFSRNMTIQWGTVPLIDQNGEITQYTIQYNPVDDKPRTNKTDAENEFYVAENLIPGKLYSIAVAASTRQGIGGFSEALFQRTLEERPGPIDQLSAIARFTSVTVNWEEPNEPNGQLIIYEVSYNTSLVGVTKKVNVTLSEGRSYEAKGLATGQSISFQVRAYTQIGPGVYTAVHAITKEKPPKVQNVTVEADQRDPNTIAIVQWNILTGIDLENVIQYKVAYESEAHEGMIKIYVESNVSSVTVYDLIRDITYLFRVSAIARIDNDIIEGDPSALTPRAVHLIPPALPSDPDTAVQFGTSIPFTFLITVLVCCCVFAVIVLVWKFRQSRKPPKQSNDQEGHYETVEMIRRQLPQIPTTLPARGPPSTSAHVSQPYKTVRPQQSDDNAEGFYDNEEPGVQDTDIDRYSAVPTTPQNVRRMTSADKLDKPAASAVIVNPNPDTQETYDTVVEPEQEPQEFYEVDPFESEHLSVRRDSNPNIYSEVNTEGKARESRGKLDTSLVVQNLAVSTGGNQAKPYEELPSRKPSANQNAQEDSTPRKPSANQNAPANTQSDEESGEEYIDMFSPLPLLSPSPMMMEGSGADTSAEQKQEVDGDKQEVGSDEQEASNTGENKSMANYFKFEDEYDTFGSRETKDTEADEEQGFYLDMSG